jgi:hypothetical protein
MNANDHESLRSFVTRYNPLEEQHIIGAVLRLHQLSHSGFVSEPNALCELLVDVPLNHHGVLRIEIVEDIFDR